jgi:hypothetical protein
MPTERPPLLGEVTAPAVKINVYLPDSIQKQLLMENFLHTDINKNVCLENSVFTHLLTGVCVSQIVFT